MHARDKKEVTLCIKKLNSPSFHPSMISLWVTDSFERKDAERHRLAKLLVNLTKTHHGTVSQSQLIKGFETVLSTLEDTVIDTPRAPEFRGLVFAKVILENVVSLNQIGQLIHEGGEEPGHLLEVGLVANVLGNVLEIIKSEKGDNGLNEIRTSSNLRLEAFRPPDPFKSRILEKFI
ncbi:eukaryotic translation initiation factor 4G-like [Pyrus ussuriensis x Pyrus communis]|uniref:Eukaryotic translation initiation factor 4G-like n=1 Tax=Pyrus ussuriensis x Pyrus communis TaxID=2448454 RepID=A0A5N5GGZ7_9ROSA|nr:eukaryotic translation initiation factor 4G-like [Pyrus ussuriensis x Pyrus communis]